MVKIYINQIPIEAEVGTTIFHAARQAGIGIPHLCYHPAFIPEGTCRMCLVEIEGFPKLELACSTQVREGMKIFTHTEKVVEARKGVLEFLLAEHPLDCPICDQAGDCKLQDYYEEYGLFENRFSEEKDKHQKKIALGKNLVHDQERCVLCRRCVRFLAEVTGTGEMGVFERGAHTEVSVMEGSPVNNEYSGNLAQICPVGAITDLDFRFQTRSWFLDKKESICPLCSRGCSIAVESHRGFSRFKLPKRVYRISARENPDINRHWICDLGRYQYGYLDRDRMLEIKFKNGKLRADWDQAINFITENLKGLYHKKKTSRISLIMDGGLTNEEYFLIKKIFVEDLPDTRIFLLPPELGKKDDLLLTAERAPNLRGANEIGFKANPFDFEDVKGASDLLLVFGVRIEQLLSESEKSALFEAVENSVIFSPHKGTLSSIATLALPTAHIAEKGGSITNCDGIVQAFSPALKPVGKARGEWEILVDLAKNMNLNYKYYQPFRSPDEIFGSLGKEIPFFENNSE